MSESITSLRRTEFTAVGKQQHKKDNVITRAWKDTVSLANFVGDHKWKYYSDPVPETVNFLEVMQGIRMVESGRLQHWNPGRTVWDIVATIQNRDKAATDPEYLIDWTPGLHTDLGRYVGLVRRERAAVRLEAAYYDLAQLAVQSTVRLALPTSPRE